MSNSIALEVANELVKYSDVVNEKFVPSEFVADIWRKFEKSYNSKAMNQNNINGKVFEEIIALCLVKMGLMPFYMQAKVAFIPNVNYDFVLYDEISPVSLSAKVSLRERWKQADLEAVALKYIHRNAKSYVITLNEKESAARKSKLSECMGINDFIVATSVDFDNLMQRLKNTNFKISPKIDVVTSNIVIDRNTATKRYTNHF